MRHFSPVKIFLAAACALPPAAAAAADWKVSSSVNYETGTYGTKKWTDSVYIPFTLKRYYAYADLSVTVPYLRQSSRGLITRVGGSPVRVGRNTASASSDTPASGLGDILVRGSLAVKKEGPRSFDLALVGNLKLPTANERKGLGTGEMDEGAGFALAKKVTPRWTLLADGYFTIIGDPPGIDYSNELALDIGFYRSVGANLWLTGLYETRSAIVSGNADPRDISGRLEYSSPGGNRYSCGLLFGLSEGSPDIGLSVGLSRGF